MITDLLISKWREASFGFRFVNYYIFPMKWTLFIPKQIERLLFFHEYSQHHEPWQENLLQNFHQTKHIVLCSWTLISSIYSLVPFLSFKIVDKIYPIDSSALSMLLCISILKCLHHHGQTINRLKQILKAGLIQKYKKEKKILKA